MAGLGLARPELEAAVLAWARVLVSTAWHRHTEVTQQPGAGVAHLHGADGPLQGELEAAPRVVEPGGAERSEEVPGPHEGGGELGDEEPHHAPLTRVPRYAARQAQQMVVTEVKMCSQSFRRRGCYLDASSVLERMTVCGPRLCSLSITSRASASVRIFWSVSSSACSSTTECHHGPKQRGCSVLSVLTSNWFGRHTSARGRICDL